MVISYHGGECFKVSFGDTTLAFNPISKDSSLKPARFGSDIVLTSIDHKDMNGAESAAFGDRTPFVVSGPGEYEVKEIVIKGFGSQSGYGARGDEKKMNTVYFVSLEGMSLCFLGALGTPDLPQEAKQDLDDIDILFVPVGGDGVLDAAAAYKLAVKLEPHIIVPMHYGEIGNKDALKQFLKEAGAESTKAEDKLTIKKKDLEGKEAEVVVLSV